MIFTWKFPDLKYNRAMLKSRRFYGLTWLIFCRFHHIWGIYYKFNRENQTKKIILFMISWVHSWVTKLLDTKKYHIRMHLMERIHSKEQSVFYAPRTSSVSKQNYFLIKKYLIYRYMLHDCLLAILRSKKTSLQLQLHVCRDEPYILLSSYQWCR